MCENGIKKAILAILYKVDPDTIIKAINHHATISLLIKEPFTEGYEIQVAYFLFVDIWSYLFSPLELQLKY